MNNKFFEWTGVTTAILYSLFVALNIGIELKEGNIYGGLLYLLFLKNLFQSYTSH